MSTNLHPAPEGLFGFSEDRYNANERRALEAGLEPCTHCGRGVQVGSGFIITVVDGGASVARPGSPESEDLNEPGFMGHWVLGPTCAKSIPSEFRTSL